jgi:hypothetical protein
MTPEHKRSIWNHVREMACDPVAGPACAIAAAKWYAANEPWTFLDLPKHLQEWIDANPLEETPDGQAVQG